MPRSATRRDSGPARTVPRVNAASFGEAPGGYGSAGIASKAGATSGRLRAGRPAQGGPLLPEPPLDCEELHPRVRDCRQAWFRATSHDPADCPPGERALHRFDCPLDLGPNHPTHYGVWYGSQTDLGAIIEKFGDAYGEITSAMRAEQRLTPMRPTRVLRLLDLRPPAVNGLYRSQSAQALDLNLSATRHYWITQEWSACLHRCVPEADGLLYVARIGGGDSVALFGGRRWTLRPTPGAVDLEDPEAEQLWAQFEDATRVPVS
jgi:hypothetical protein